MKTIAVRLTEGQDLLSTIQEIIDKHQVKAGVVLSAVGSLSKSNIRVPVVGGQVKTINPENLEIDSLHGTLSPDGCHLHIVVSDLDGRVWGGHLKEDCKVRTTCELIIGVLEDQTFSRIEDESTGFKELRVDVV